VDSLESGQLRRWKYAMNTPINSKRMTKVILVIAEVHDHGGGAESGRCWKRA
jgi:hypothetical protein